MSVKWKEVAPLPVGVTAHTAVLLQGSVYVGGGYEGSCDDDLEYSYRLNVYNLTTNRWDHSPITTPHCWFGMTVLEDKLIIAGGLTRSGEPANSIFTLDEGVWKCYSEMPTSRESPVAVGYQSVLLVVGGQTKVDGTFTRLATTELLDTTNGRWYTCDDFPVPHLQLKTTVVNSTLYLLGGNVHGSRQSLLMFTASLDNLSSHKLNWQSLPDTPWCYSAPAVLYNKFLLTVGGRQPSNKAVKTTAVCAFNQSTGLWKQTANIPAAMSSPAAVGVTDNKILVLGGTNSNQAISRSTWIGIFE